LPPEPGTAQNEPPEAIWEPFCYQSPEQFKMSLQRPSGNPSGTAQNEPPEAIWE